MNRDFFIQHGFELSDREIAQFEQFLTLFIEYNSHTNLSAIRDEEGIVEKHFIDSLYGVPMIEDILSSIGHTPRLLDIGAGGGFPGIPLKMVIPELDVTLLDSVGKKVKAMNHFIEHLGLPNIRALQERAEILVKDSHHRGQYDIITSRATAYITDILSWAVPFLAPQGVIVLYKMPSDEETKDREKILKKLGLVLEGEFMYELGGKSRIIYRIKRR